MSLSDKDTFIQQRVKVIMARGFNREDAFAQAAEEWAMEKNKPPSKPRVRTETKDFVAGLFLLEFRVNLSQVIH